MEPIVSTKATKQWRAFCVGLLLCVWPLVGGLQAGTVTVGIDYVFDGSEPLSFLEDPNGDPVVHILPYPLSSPDSRLVTDGGFAGVPEAQLQADVFRKVQEKFYSIPVQSGRELDIDFVLGRAEGEGSVNAILGRTESTVLTWFGYTPYVGSGLQTPSGGFPDGQNATAVSVENLSEILGGELGVSYASYETALNVVANLAAHEIGHVYGLHHVPVEPPGPESDLPEGYPLMATIPEGMPPAGWTLDNAFSKEPGVQPGGGSSVEDLVLRIGLRRIGDLDADGDVDTADINQAVANFTGASPDLTSPKRSLGDADHDGDIDTADINAAVGNFTGAMAEAPGAATVIVDRQTGQIVLDAGGTAMAGFTLRSDSGAFTADTPDFSDLPRGLTDDIDRQMGWFDALGRFHGVADLGVVMDVSRFADDAAIIADLGDSFHAPSPDSGGVGRQMEVRVVPEPATLSLLAIGGVVALLGRRRQGRVL